MNRVVRYLMMAVMACFFMVPALKSEAATIAVLPLINKAEDTDTAMVRQIYFDKCVGVTKTNSEYVLVDSEQLDKIIGKNTKENVLPTEQQLRAIAKEANVDFVLAMELDKMYSNAQTTKNDRYIILNIRGTTVWYNRMTDKFQKHTIWEEKEYDEVFNARWDIMKEEWSRTVSREVNKAIGNKKLNLEAPRITKL